MVNLPKIDFACVPFKKKRRYWVLTIPLLALLVVTSLYLWRIGSGLGLIYIGFFIVLNFADSYLCSVENCPYVGKPCPGMFGLFLVGVLAGIRRRIKVKQNQVISGVCGGIVGLSTIGLVLFPLNWLAKRSLLMALGYFLVFLIYYLVYILTICPHCAKRNDCPAARLVRNLWS